MKIPFTNLTRQYENLKQELLDATDSALKSGQLVNGEYTKKFEQWLRQRCKTKYAVTVHSGTQALELIAFFKREIHYQHFETFPKVRIPNLTYPATLNAFLKAGWFVELVDTDKFGIIENAKEFDPDTYDCYVGLYGRMPHSNKIYKESFNIIVDGAQHWLVCDGNVGSGMAISFDPTKNLPSSGNGGAIVTNNDDLYNFAMNYRDNAKNKKFAYIGTNSKMSEQDCAQTLVRAKYIDKWQKRRESIASYWYKKFQDTPLTILNKDANVPHSFHKFVIYTPYLKNFFEHLTTSGIEVKRHYSYVLGDLDIGKNLPKPDLMSTSVMLSRGVLSLPFYPELTDFEVEYIADRVLDLYRNINSSSYY